MRHHITRATRHLIFWSLVLSAIGLTAVRVLLIGVDNYKTYLETHISTMMGAPVTFGSLSANMRGVSPEVVIKDISIASVLSEANPAIHLHEIRLGINLGEFLLSRDALASSWFTLVGAELSIIRTQDGQLVIKGLKAGGGEPLWLLQGRQYEVLKSQISWQDLQKESKPIVLDAVNVVVMNNGKHHHINIVSKLPKKIGDSLLMVVDFEAEANKLSEVKGKVYLEGENIRLAEVISAYLPLDISMKSGAIDMRLWSQWQQAKLVSIKTDAQIKQGLFVRKGKGNFVVNHLDTQFNWAVNDNQWQLDINRFLLDSSEQGKKASQKWPDIILSLAEVNANATIPHHLKMRAKQIDLAEVTKLIQFFAPLREEHHLLVSQAQISGLLTDFSIYAEPDNRSVAVAGWFDSLSVEPVKSQPGFEKISGQIKGDEFLGAVELSGQDFNVKASALFDKPIFLNKFHSIVGWQQLTNKWLLSTQSLAIDCPAFKSESRLLLKLPKNEQSPFIDLQTSLKSDDLGQIKNYLPTNIIKPIIKNWLEPAFVGGKITKGDLLFYGEANDFPFAKGTGVFEAAIDLDKLELNFNPEWLHLTEVTGRVRFERTDIVASLKSGKIGKVKINKADALIPGLGSNDERLFIKGEAEGDMGDVLNALEQSPLKQRISQVTKATSVNGSAQVTVDLTIPMWQGQELVTDGNVKLKNNQLTVKQLDLKVNTISGDLKFNKNGIYGTNINAFSLGHSIKIDIDQEHQQTLINVVGSTSVGQLDTLFGWTESTIAEGEGDYQLQLKLPNSQVDEPVSVSIKSTLEGVSLQLPGTLAKTKNQHKPTSVSINLGDELVLPIELDYNNELKAAIMLSTKEQKINSGHVLIGNGSAKQTKTPGLKLEINREQLALQDWFGLASSQQTNKTTVDVSEVKIHSPTALLNKTRLGVFDLDLKRSPSEWTGVIDSTIAKGKFQLPLETNGTNPIVLNMDMLNLTALKQLKSPDASSNTKEFKPIVKIQSEKALWLGRNLGQLILETQRTPTGMTIKRLDVIGENEKLLANGNWQEAGLRSQTHIDGKIELKKADEFFDKLNITKDLTGASGVINFNLNWDLAPWQLLLTDLRGTMDVKLKSGRILSIEPGFGRVLGILAVAQWIKRLQLDFGDIYQEGLTFNSIEGHFDIVSGKANTKDLVIDAVPAKISISGDTDLVNQTVNYDIKVVPKSLDAVPIAGTIVSRIAAMVGKTLTGKDQEGFFFGMHYLVKGNWDDIKVSSQHENDGLFQKTWNSITDFPWQEQKK